ncbi:hypothetical protein VH86_04880 [Pantoea sp. BL1]|nr:hypothetical protein NH00_07360 [Enterobacter cancerogenus]KJV33134.1 hypothetical protein VI01_06770 [Pantoea sp. SM3]KJV49608.1 hypothetical protein VH86_04880 [Pantoea sp. BL1]
MKNIRRKTWIMVFLFCVLFWGVVFTAISFANENGKNKPVAQVNGPTKLVDIQKIKQLKLNDKQKKFIESLIEPADKKSD